MEDRKARFPIGTTFNNRGKIATVIDILTTYNIKKEVVKIRYVSVHNFLKQEIINDDVVDATIARNLIELGKEK